MLLCCAEAGGSRMTTKMEKDQKIGKSQEKVVFLKNINKTVLVKKNISSKTWQNSIYGFECANWTKC